MPLRSAEKSRAFRQDFWAQPAFTLIEVLISLLIVCILTGLVLVSVKSLRSSMRLAKCLNRAGNISIAMSMYTSSSRGVFLANRSDDSQSLRTDKAIAAFVQQPYQLFYEEPWLSYAPATLIGSGLHCASIPVPYQSAASDRAAFKISSSVFIDPSYLSGSRFRRNLGARVQSIDNVLFPSAKALVFEHYNWHVLSKEPPSRLVVSDITPEARSCAVSVAFCDGSASSLLPRDFGPSVVLPPWTGSAFALTKLGVRGRDR